LGVAPLGVLLLVLLLLLLLPVMAPAAAAGIPFCAELAASIDRIEWILASWICQTKLQIYS
jgi:hypothetical protein